MTYVKIAKLKSELSKYLRVARQGGEVVVSDRNTPIVKIIPFQESVNHLTIRAAKKKLQSSFQKIRPALLKQDSLSVLLELRGEK